MKRCSGSCCAVRPRCDHAFIPTDDIGDSVSVRDFMQEEVKGLTLIIVSAAVPPDFAAGTTSDVHFPLNMNVFTTLYITQSTNNQERRLHRMF